MRLLFYSMMSYVWKGCARLSILGTLGLHYICIESKHFVVHIDKGFINNTGNLSSFSNTTIDRKRTNNSSCRLKVFNLVKMNSCLLVCVLQSCSGKMTSYRHY